MSLRDDLCDVLKRLRLKGLAESLDARLDQAANDDLPYLEFLYRLLSDEAARRDQRQLELRVRRARFEQEKVLEDFDWGFNPAVPRSKILDLASCRFVEQRQVKLLVGKAGIGKSHLAQAIGHQACRQGYSVLYRGAKDLFCALRAARADDSLEDELRKLTKPELLIVDDLGLQPLPDHGPHDLYELITRRYERGATLWTSNRDPDEWWPLFGDPLLASAAMDRLLHHAEVIVLEGDSYRNPPPGKAVVDEEAA